jgi:hypothetical protein
MKAKKDGYHFMKTKYTKYIKNQTEKTGVGESIIQDAGA